MEPILFIDLIKAGKKGMSWAKHKYIARVLLTNGEYAYIQPDDDEGHFEWGMTTDPETNEKKPGWLFKLAQGKSLASIINRHLWGGFEGEYTKQGRPKAPDGIFRHYEVISKREYDWEKTKSGKTPFADALKREKVGDYYVFAYPNVPQIGTTSEGKPRYGGYTHIHWNSSVKGKYNYEETKELLNHKATSEEDLAAAQRVHTYLAEGGEQPGPEALALKEKERRTKEDIQRDLDLKIPDNADPLPIAKLLRDRLYARRVARKDKGKAGVAVAPGQSGKVEKFPQWMIDKYGGEQGMLDAIRERPATTLVSLGIVTPTRHSHALLKRINEEWRNEIVRGAKAGPESLRWTELYNRLKKLDDADGLDMTDENSRVRKEKSQWRSDLISEGYTHLHELVLKYNPDNVKHLESYIRTSLRNHMNRMSQQWAREQLTTAEFVEDHNVEEAAHRMRQTTPFTPEDAAELNRMTEAALPIINRVLNTEHFPDTFRRVLTERLFLTDPRVEAAEIAEHERMEADKRAAADASGKKYKREPRKMVREWEEVAHRLKKVTDPDTGKEIDLTTLPRSTRDRKMLTWFNEGVDKLRRELSVGAKPHDLQNVERREALAHKLGISPRTPWNMLEVEAKPTEYTPEEKIYHTALGDKKKVVRLLTNEGQVVKRYFELEAKLSAAARQHGTVKEEIARQAYPLTKERPASEEDKTTRVVNVTLPKNHKIDPVKHVLLIPAGDDTAHRSHSPAIGFFTASKNQQLVRKLGINLQNMQAGGGAGGAVWHQPNISLGTKAQRDLATIERHYQMIQAHSKASNERLKALHGQASHAIEHLQGLGTWSRRSRGSEAAWKEGDHGISKVHEAAAAYQSALGAVQHKQETRAAIRREFNEARRATGPVEDHVHLTESVLKHKLSQHATTDQEKKEVERARQAYEKVSQHVARFVPSIKEMYDLSLKGNKTIMPHHLSTARARVSHALNEAKAKAALVQFEMDQRKIVKSMVKTWVHADALTAAIYEYDFELGRLDAALEAA